MSNRTGVPLQVMQHTSEATMQPLGQAAIGVEPATGPGLPKGQPGQRFPPGLKGAIVDQSVDWTTCTELPAGRANHHLLASKRMKLLLHFRYLGMSRVDHLGCTCLQNTFIFVGLRSHSYSIA